MIYISPSNRSSANAAPSLVRYLPQFCSLYSPRSLQTRPGPKSRGVFCLATNRLNATHSPQRENVPSWVGWSNPGAPGLSLRPHPFDLTLYIYLGVNRVMSAPANGMNIPVLAAPVAAFATLTLRWTRNRKAILSSGRNAGDANPSEFASTNQAAGAWPQHRPNGLADSIRKRRAAFRLLQAAHRLPLATSHPPDHVCRNLDLDVPFRTSFHPLP